ncbi:fumarylacetoacetate hydrolase family protein [Haladaptatus salinisoli]|uniref:fumarylacetoacetate hydrolase family protein n=1 Tax=Haladaptatus salinisoli TaxID=2884876 RepID=UPI001D0A436F|nr:fumarylacetoacetate hydrolase family protein [Haladaptatus salinisoli]
MRYYQVSRDAEEHLVAETNGQYHDLSSVKVELSGFDDLLRTAAVVEKSADEVASKLVDSAPTVDPDEVAVNCGLPIIPEEVWAAGVTYEISEQARKEESGMPEMYLDVYQAERPEIFFKATPSRTVGPDEAIGVREDSQWNVPEPELGIVLYQGDIVGYTIGNDVSSREIEGANPLYLPQAKVYDRCVAVGPAIASPDTVGDPQDLSMTMTIERDGETCFSGETSTGEMIRTCEELTHCYTQHNAVPELAVLMTGTSIVPAADFNLQEGDTVTIDIESIGTLLNPVISV